MRFAHLNTVSVLALTATACGGKTSSPDSPVACTLEAAPSAAPVGGDANGDGLVDVSDGVYLERAVFSGGPAVACKAAVDIVPDGVIDAGEAMSLWYFLGPKSQTWLPTVDATTCPAVARATTPACGDGLALGIDAPATVSGTAGAATTFAATVTLTNPALTVDGWSFSLTATGCAITAGTTAGTTAADRADLPPGLRDGGFAWQKLPSEREADVMTVLDWRNPISEAASASPVAIHAFTVSGVPSSGCSPCTLSLVSGDPATAVEAIVSGDGGYRYVPALATVTISICAG